jgi:hypothetical protein
VYTLDTNTIIYYSKRDATVTGTVEQFFTRNTLVYVSTITELELFSFTALSDEVFQRIEQFLTTVMLIPVDSHLARIAAYLRRHYRLKTPDSVIAATALVTHTTLVTRNVRDFQKIDTLQLMTI